MAVESVVTTQVTASFIVVWLIEKLKATKLFPWVTEETAGLNKLIAGFAAAATAAGISWSFDTTGGVLTISGITAASALSFLWSWVQSLAVQETLYKGVVKKHKRAPKRANDPEPAEAEAKP